MCLFVSDITFSGTHGRRKDATASKLLGGEGGGLVTNPPRSRTLAAVEALAPPFGRLREAAGASVHGGEEAAAAERVQMRLRVAQPEKGEA